LEAVGLRIRTQEIILFLMESHQSAAERVAQQERLVVLVVAVDTRVTRLGRQELLVRGMRVETVRIPMALAAVVALVRLVLMQEIHGVGLEETASPLRLLEPQ
jgi:hypothetical protein